MKTGFADLDNLIKLDAPQIIACTGIEYYYIESFLRNILINLSVHTKEPTLYIDNCLMHDYKDSIKKEREILFNKRLYEIELVPEFASLINNTIDDLISNIAMVNRFEWGIELELQE